MKEPLKNAKHELFCQHYIVHFNAHKAYIEAGFKDTIAARTAASKLLAKDNIQRRIQFLTQQRIKTVKINADYVLKRLVEIDELDVADLFDDEFNMKPISKWSKAWRTSLSAMDIQKIKSGEDIETVISKIKMPDKVKNLELLGKHIDVKAWDKEKDSDLPAQPMAVYFTAKPAVGQVKVTNG